MQIPIYDEGGAPVEAPGVPTARLNPITPAASGAQVAEAAGGVAKAGEQLGESIGRDLVYYQRLESQTKAREAAIKGDNQLDDVMYGENGLMLRQGANARGISHGNDPEKIDSESIHGRGNEILSNLTKDAGPLEKKLIEREFMPYLHARVSAAMRYEGQQTRIARDDTRVAGIHTDANVFAIDPIDPKTGELRTDLLQHAKGLQSERDSEAGNIDPSAVALNHLKVGDEFAKALVKANIDKDPQLTKDTLQKMIDTKMVSPDIGIKDDKGKYGGPLVDHVEGKWLDMRREAVAADSLKFKDNDGFVRLDSAEKNAQSWIDANKNDLRPGDGDHIMKYVREQATMQNSARKQKMDEGWGEMSRDVQKQLQSGQTPTALDKQMSKKYDGLLQPDDIHDQIFKLATKDDAAYEKQISHMQPGSSQWLAWEQVKEMVNAAYPKTRKAVLPGDEGLGQINLRDAAMLEMKRKLLGMPADQMINGAKDMLKNSVIEKGAHWYNFDTTGQEWERERLAARINDQEMGKLEQHPTYSPLVSETRAALIRRARAQGTPNFAPTARQIKEAIDRSMGATSNGK